MNSLVISFLMAIALASRAYSWPNFHLYTRKNANDVQVITPLNITKSLFNKRNRVVTLVHGFSDAGLTTGLILVKDALLIAEDMNVIVVDWRVGAAGPNYHNAAQNTRVTARKLSEFLEESQLDQSKVHCIGHSLGAHVCGFAGKIKKFKRISGLDPAGPEFSGKIHRLNSTDAEFVDVIHTDGFYGIDYAIGSVDFFPNGGRFQAGCGLLGRESQNNSTSLSSTQSRFNIVEHLSCSHSRVVLFYAESVLSSCQFVSTPCVSYDKFKSNKCACSEATPCARMGYHADQGNPRGNYYLNTNKQEPFCLL